MQQSLFDGLDKSEVFPFFLEELVISPEPILRLEKYRIKAFLSHFHLIQSQVPAAAPLCKKPMKLIKAISKAKHG